VEEKEDDGGSRVHFWCFQSTTVIELRSTWFHFSYTSMFNVGRSMFDVQGAHRSSAADRTRMRSMSRQAVCLIIGLVCWDSWLRV
jgi:hypothetical protein